MCGYFLIGCLDDVSEIRAVWLAEKEGVYDSVLVARSRLKCLCGKRDVKTFEFLNTELRYWC
jgi:hypothetical protein